MHSSPARSRKKNQLKRLYFSMFHFVSLIKSLMAISGFFKIKPTPVPNTEFIIYYSVKFQYIVGYNKWVFVTLV